MIQAVGVQPDIAAPAPDALAIAQLTALQKRLPLAADPPVRTEITSAIERLKAELDAHKPQ